MLATVAYAEVTEIALGYIHSCALLTGGAVKCWGWNRYGQLGDVTTTTRTTPVGLSNETSAATSTGNPSIMFALVSALPLVL